MKAKFIIRIIILVVLSSSFTSTNAKQPKKNKETVKVHQKRNKYNPHSRYAKLPRWGHVYKVAPKNAVIVSYRGAKYHFHSGIFYKPVGKTYVIAKAPVGISVRTLPKACIHFNYKGKKYHYYYGTYYVKSNNNYVIVAPPVGAKVDALPESYTEVEKNGNIFYKFDGTFYKEVEIDNEIWYEVIGRRN